MAKYEYIGLKKILLYMLFGLELSKVFL